MFVSAEVLEGNQKDLLLKTKAKFFLFLAQCNPLKILKLILIFEGVNLSLLSRVMSSRLSRGTYNGGLLSTEAGTIARVIADVTITVAGYFGRDMLLNVTLLPSLVTCVVSIVATCFTYNSLY